MDDLEQDLREHGWGIVKTIGGYPEQSNGYEENKRHVREPSYMATKETQESPEKIIKWLLDLAKDYNQDGVIVKLPGDAEAYEYKPKEKVTVPYGTPEMKRKADFYTHLRKGQDPEQRKLVYTQAYSKDSVPLDPSNPSAPGE